MRKKVVSIIVALVLVSVTLLTLCACSVTQVGEADFRVLQITDVHIVNNAKKDKKAFKTIDVMLEKSNPDLIIVTGDVTSEKDNMTAIRTFSEYMESKQIPWAFTFGNHDAEGDVKKPEISEYLESLNYCIYERGDPNLYGYGHYTYDVQVEGQDIMTLIMMDSNMYYEEDCVCHPDGNKGYDNFKPNQIEWYRKTVMNKALAVNGDPSKVLPSLAFFHIPMQEYYYGYLEAKKDKNIVSGKKNEAIYSSKHSDILFETMLELGSTKGVFVGHDHMNDYSINYQGIRLTYGNSCDHNIYLVPRRGGTLINIKKDGTFKTQRLYKGFGLSNLTIDEEH